MGRVEHCSFTGSMGEVNRRVAGCLSRGCVRTGFYVDGEP